MTGYAIATQRECKNTYGVVCEWLQLGDQELRVISIKNICSVFGKRRIMCFTTKQLVSLKYTVQIEGTHVGPVNKNRGAV